MLKKIIAVSLMLAVVGAHAEGLNSTNTVGSNSGASSSNTVQPVQAINSYGARQPAMGPELAVGGSIGTHLCETTGGISGGWMTGDAGVIIPISRQYCVYLNVYDALQQAAVNEGKDGHPERATAARDASYELLAHVDATVKGILQDHGLVGADGAATAAHPAYYPVADTK